MHNAETNSSSSSKQKKSEIATNTIYELNSITNKLSLFSNQQINLYKNKIIIITFYKVMDASFILQLTNTSTMSIISLGKIKTIFF